MREALRWFWLTTLLHGGSRFEGSSFQYKGDNDGHVGLFSNKGLVLVSPMSLSHNTKCTYLRSCNEGVSLRELP